MKQWRVGIIGVGAIGTSGHLVGYQSAGANVVAVADVAEGRAAKVAEREGIAASYTDYRDMLANEDLDVVSVCTPNALHAPMTIDALRAGAHVLCEKPMALTLAEATEMVATAEAAGKGLSIAHTLRHRPENERIKAMAAAGDLGDIYHVKVSYLRRRHDGYRLPHAGPGVVVHGASASDLGIGGHLCAARDAGQGAGHLGRRSR
jgi:UDP-N-acetylglucosamine 3-dehydrogenase